MTIDKIKHYMNPTIFNYWKEYSQSDRPIEEIVTTIRKAARNLEKEIADGILENKIEYQAEIELLRMLAG